ncbi:hypothetical protein [Streptomyces sp. NPDC097619]|uniref:hypothetical protein n=1 Tax=Streptomyces sp. NPDC097619 TaxID=3157228 RepID=UPI0033342389
MTPRTAVDAAAARRALAAGTAVVLPGPAPLTHVIAATVPEAVNLAKGRPAGQAVALWAHDPDTLDSLDEVWDLGPEQRAPLRLLLRRERLTVLLPVRSGAPRPPWLEPAVREERSLLFGSRWDPLRPVLDEFPVLYVSSANRTGGPPVAGTAEALATFPAEVPVLAAPDPAGEDADTGPRAATTTVRIRPDGTLALHRPGAQDRAHGGPEAYLRHLRAPSDTSGSPSPGPPRVP